MQKATGSLKEGSLAVDLQALRSSGYWVPVVSS